MITTLILYPGYVESSGPWCVIYSHKSTGFEKPINALKNLASYWKMGLELEHEYGQWDYKVSDLDPDKYEDVSKLAGDVRMCMGGSWACMGDNYPNELWECVETEWNHGIGGRRSWKEVAQVPEYADTILAELMLGKEPDPLHTIDISTMR